MPADDETHGAPSDQFLTRRQAARRLGCSLGAVRNAEGRGELHGIKRFIDDTERYKFVFRRAEVEAIADKNKRVLSATPDSRDQRVFDAFRSGKTVVDVVIEFGIASDVVRHLWKNYREGRTQGENAPAYLDPTHDEVLAQIERDNKTQDAELAKTYESIGRIRVTRAALIKTRRKGAA